MEQPSRWFPGIIKPFVFAMSLLPFVWLVVAFLLNGLGANPVEALTRQTGEWGLRFLLLGLLLSPLRRWLGWAQGIRLQRMLGLFAFFYATVHLVLYLWLDQDFDWREIWHDLLERPFITVGMLAFVLLIPLAATSTHHMIRRLGKRWKQLHRLLYPASMLVVLHFWWMKDSKSDVSEPLIYAVILAALLGERWHASTRSLLSGAAPKT